MKEQITSQITSRLLRRTTESGFLSVAALFSNRRMKMQTKEKETAANTAAEKAADTAALASTSNASRRMTAK